MIWTKHEHCKAHMCPYDRNSHKVHVATQPQPSWAGKRNIFDALHFELWMIHFAILLEKMVLVVSRKWSLWQFEPILFRGERALNNWSKDILCCDMLKNKALILETKRRPTIWKHYIEESVLLTGLKNKRQSKNFWKISTSPSPRPHSLRPVSKSIEVSDIDIGILPIYEEWRPQIHAWNYVWNFGISDELYFFSLKRDSFMG